MGRLQSSRFVNKLFLRDFLGLLSFSGLKQASLVTSTGHDVDLRMLCRQIIIVDVFVYSLVFCDAFTLLEVLANLVC